MLASFSQDFQQHHLLSNKCPSVVAAPHTLRMSLLHRVKHELVHRNRTCRREL